MSVWKPTLNLGKFNSLEDIKNYISNKKNLSKIFTYTGAIVFPVLIIKYKRSINEYPAQEVLHIPKTLCLLKEY